MPGPNSQGTGREPVGQESARVKALMEQALGRGMKIISLQALGQTDSAGYPMFRVVYAPIRYKSYDTSEGVDRNGPIIRKTVSFYGGKVFEPYTQGSGTPTTGDTTHTYGDDSTLVDAKDQALVWLQKEYAAKNLDLESYNRIQATIEGWNGTPQQLQEWVFRTNMQLPLGYGITQNGDNWYDDGGGGGLGGFTGPVYKAPDRRVIEDMAKGMMVSLVGTVKNKYLDKAVNLYMRDHRRDWDSTGETIDPGQSMLEFIRGTEEYKNIHELRPESEDERSWVSDRRSAAERGGLQTNLQEDFAISQAKVGGDLKDTERAAAVRQTVGSGTSRGTVIDNAVRGVARAMFSGVA